MITVLVLLAIHIWVRDSNWPATAQDSWPILAGIPIFIWFRRPWVFADPANQSFPARGVAAITALYLLGVLLNSTLFLALGWTLLFRTWLITRTDAGLSAACTTKLLALPFFSFPWIATDLNSVGWFFRLSGAAVVELLFAALQFDVVRHGTLLSVQGKLMSVEAACSGLNGLQSMLIAGTTMAYLKLKDSPRFWWNLPTLVGAAWLANTIRIAILAFTAVESSLDTQSQFIHGLAGCGSLGLAFGLCWFFFGLQEPKSRRRWIEPAGQHSG
ncbi:MAG: exosortase/archaeosortase family protein [Verrucomicrobia bacterium]|nr:exosortase/archaeosortase family protein [Verrucomicrobiota bacterium]